MGSDRATLIRSALLAMLLLFPVLIVCGEDEAPPIDCDADDQCDQAGGYFCSGHYGEAGVCVGPCTDDTDCGADPTTTFCDAGRCRFRCVEDSDCPADKPVCFDTRRCVECETSADCGELQVCNDLICSNVDCIDDDDCSAGTRCEFFSCVPIPCDEAAAPTCAGACGVDEECASNIAGDLCECMPIPCDASAAPACGGECPSGEACVSDIAGDLCECVSTACEAGSAPACGGECPPGEACVPDTAGDLCECVSTSCEAGTAPACGGQCPLGEECRPDAGETLCECIDPGIPCDWTQGPVCGGACPPGLNCVGPDFSTCYCAPPGPCSNAIAPACVGGECPAGEFCFGSVVDCFCTAAASLQSVAAPPFFYGVDKNPSLELSPDTAGASAQQRLGFDVTLDELETYKARIRYPAEFGFQGFLALGPIGTQIGLYGFDFDGDGAPDASFPLRALDEGAAYADTTRNGHFVHGRDPIIELTGNPEITATLPHGGDGDLTTIGARSDARRIVVIDHGIFTNPSEPGTYTLEGCFTSVDPDTDGADDGQGDPPQHFCDDFAVEVGGGMLAVGIDIKPGNAQNVINPGSEGKTRVALLGSETLAIDQVDPATLAFGPNGAMTAGKSRSQDVNRDGHPDLVSRYETEQTGIVHGETNACLRGALRDGTPFEGCEAIRTVPGG